MEAERLQNEQTKNLEKINVLEAEKKNLRDELKELKNREQLLMNDNNELEEENVNLQKQVILYLNFVCFFFKPYFLVLALRVKISN